MRISDWSSDVCSSDLTNRWTDRRVGGHDLLDPTPTVLAPTQPGSSPPPPAQPREDAGRKPRTCPLKSVTPALDPAPGGVRPPLLRYCRGPDRPPAAPPRRQRHARLLPNKAGRLPPVRPVSTAPATPTTPQSTPAWPAPRPTPLQPPSHPPITTTTP